MGLGKPSQVCSRLSAGAPFQKGVLVRWSEAKPALAFYTGVEESTSMGLLPVRAVACQGSLERPVPSGAEDVTGLCERSTAILLTGRADRGVKARVNTPKERPSFWRQVLGLGRWHSHCPGFGVLVRGLWLATTCMEIAGVNARHSPVL